MPSFLYPVHLIKLDTIGSTNDYLKKIQRSDFSLDKWVVAWALEQTKGRGTYGNYWQSEKFKNLTFSFLFRVAIPVRKKFLLNICISNGIHKTLCLEGKGFSIKWPNDILLRGKKIAGILIENTIAKEYIQNSIVGIGLNVHQEKFGTLNRASSLKNLLCKNFDLDKLLINLLKNIQKEYQQFLQGNQDMLINYYLLHLFGKNQKRCFKVNDSICEGKIEGIDIEGRLLVSFGEHKKSYFLPKEIYMMY